MFTVVSESFVASTDPPNIKRESASLRLTLNVNATGTGMIKKRSEINKHEQRNVPLNSPHTPKCKKLFTSSQRESHPPRNLKFDLVCRWFYLFLILTHPSSLSLHKSVMCGSALKRPNRDWLEGTNRTENPFNCVSVSLDKQCDELHYYFDWNDKQKIPRKSSQE